MQILQDLLGFCIKSRPKLSQDLDWACFWSNWDWTILTTVILDSSKPPKLTMFLLTPSQDSKKLNLESCFFQKKSSPGTFRHPSSCEPPPKNPPKTPSLHTCRCFRPWPQLLVASPEWQREGPGRLLKVPFDTSKMMVFFDRKTSWKLGALTFFETSNKTYIFFERKLFWSNP